MDELDDLAGQVDVAIAINSLVMPDVRKIERTLRAIRACLRPGGVFLGIVPSLDAIQYQTLLLYDQALEHGLDPRTPDGSRPITPSTGYTISPSVASATRGCGRNSGCLSKWSIA